MEHFGHENLSLCILSTFSTYHRRICPLLFWSCCQFFKQHRVNLLPNIFVLRDPLFCLRSIKWHSIDRVSVALRHAISKYFFWHLEKQWHQGFINLITYNITTVLSIIAGRFIRNHHLVCIDRKYISCLSLPIKVFSRNLFLTKFKDLLLIHF